ETQEETPHHSISQERGDRWSWGIIELAELDSIAQAIAHHSGRPGQAECQVISAVRGLVPPLFSYLPRAYLGRKHVNRDPAAPDAAAIAFLIMTAEDEMADGATQARMNVIHEAGLFQTLMVLLRS